VNRRRALSNHESGHKIEAQGPQDTDYPDDLSEVMNFSSYDLRTTIRLIVLSGESRKIDVERGTKRGSIYIKSGEVYRVETNEAHGDEAFFEILSWKNVNHSDSLQRDQIEENVRIGTEVLLDILREETSSTD
jgi:hypothetical protein